ncbi:MAG TPA: c-type cytochrome [Solirubrobacteraceae bacterium]|jgi:mono/diheme cytochrome c family protein|nr:c-type cytochrome [Solirubrobacteraceae bacterium]
MSRLAKILALCTAAATVGALTAACGTQKIAVPKSQTQLYHGAVLFSQRCAGCHTLSYAATNGSAPNIRTAQANSGPNFNQRCERPVERVLYAIINGGFSGAIMPQNVVVGQDAIDVAKFVATYAGRQAPNQLGVVKCVSKPIGTIPSSFSQAAASTGGPTATTAAGVPARSARPARSATAMAAVPRSKGKRSAHSS